MQLQHEIELHAAKQAREKQGRKSPAALPAYDVPGAVARLVSLADEKVTIAAQVYDFIDKHIHSLDEDLRALDSEIRADKASIGMGEDESASEQLQTRAGRGRASAEAANTDSKKKRGRKRSALEVEEEDGGFAAGLACMHAACMGRMGGACGIVAGAWVSTPQFTLSIIPGGSVESSCLGACMNAKSAKTPYVFPPSPLKAHLSPGQGPLRRGESTMEMHRPELLIPGPQEAESPGCQNRMPHSFLRPKP